MFTWEYSQTLNYLAASGLHGNLVITHQECKHDQGYKLTCVGLQHTKIRNNINLVSLIQNTKYSLIQNIKYMTYRVWLEKHQ